MARRKRPREAVTVAQMSPRKLTLLICCCILFAYCLLNMPLVAGFMKRIMSALGPVLTGFVFAYILNPAASWLEKRLNRLFAPVIRRHPGFAKFTRAFSAFFMVLIFLGSLVLLVIAISAQVVDGVTTLISKMPGYVNTVTERVEELFRRDTTFSNFLKELNERFSASDLGMGNIDAVDLSQKILSTLSTGLVGTLGVLYNVIIGFVIAVYLLISRKRFVKQFRQILYAVCNEDTAAWISKNMTDASRTFGMAVLGKFADSLIIALLCFAGNKALGMPYATLIAVIIGVTNMIPFFGPIIGAIPCVLLVLMENPVKALYFAVFVIVLQQFDANFLDPKIVGNRIGLPAFWSLFACMLGGGQKDRFALSQRHGHALVIDQCGLTVRDEQMRIGQSFARRKVHMIRDMVFPCSKDRTVRDDRAGEAVPLYRRALHARRGRPCFCHGDRLINVQGSGIAVLVRPVIIIDAVGDVGI